MNNLPIKDLAVLIADAILGGGFKTKEEALPRVELLLGSFIRANKDRPRPISNKKAGDKLERVTKAVYQKNIESLFWRKKTRYFAPNRMEEFYAELDEQLRQAGIGPNAKNESE